MPGADISTLCNLQGLAGLQVRALEPCITNVTTDEKVERRAANLIRAMRNDLSIVHLDLSSAKTIEVASDEPCTFFTFALTGCQSVCLVSKYGDGSYRATMTHYSNGEILEHLKKLREHGSTHGPEEGQPASHLLLVALPGMLRFNPNTGCEERVWNPVGGPTSFPGFEPNYFQRFAENMLSCGITCRVLPYLIPDFGIGDDSFILQWKGGSSHPTYDLQGTSTGELVFPF